MNEASETSTGEPGASGVPADAATGGSNAFATLAGRLRVRRAVLAAAAIAIVAGMAFGGLRPVWAAAGFAIVVLTAAVTPRTPRPAVADASGQAASRAEDREMWVKPVLEAMPDPAVALNQKGAILFFNDLANRTVGPLRPGSPIATVIRNPEIMEAVASAASHGGRHTVTYDERVPVERRIAATVGSLFEGDAENLSGDADRPVVLLTLRDLTEEQRLAQMRADFIANASHELRTPLASLHGFIETLQGTARNDAEARERFLEVMRNQTGRMTRLIDDLLSLSRVEMNLHVLPDDEVELDETVRHVVEALEPLAKDRGITLTCETEPQRAPVRGDRDELVQVFQNLIQNAIKYGASGGRVGVAVVREDAEDGHGGKIAVHVRDDGPGIPPVHLPRLTERFYRVDVASSREKGGTGLGLAIVKHVLNRHRADLKIDSTVGEGSTFTAIFDAAEID